MRCIIVDDEPLAREGIASLVNKTPGVELVGSYNSANAAARYLSEIELHVNQPHTTTTISL